jgi:hypothetical protein
LLPEFPNAPVYVFRLVVCAVAPDHSLTDDIVRRLEHHHHRLRQLLIFEQPV